MPGWRGRRTGLMNIRRVAQVRNARRELGYSANSPCGKRDAQKTIAERAVRNILRVLE